MRFALALILVLLSGCSSLDGLLANRLACSLDRKVGIYASMYGPIGIASKVDSADVAVLCAAVK